jgi:ADP-heptose:LPS heptosyltransferase
VRWLARLLPAKRRIHYQKTHADLYPERPAMPADPDLFDPGWRVARMVARHFPKPESLCVPSLARRYAATVREGEVIGVVPFADELRKNFDAHSLRVLLEALRAQHPSARLRIFFNPSDRGSGVIREVVLPENADLRPFRALRDLLQEYLQISSWIGTDTGLFHLAVAMGIPARVFFGPTQPWKIVRPHQPHTKTVRCWDKTTARSRAASVHFACIRRLRPGARRIPLPTFRTRPWHVHCGRMPRPR